MNASKLVSHAVKHGTQGFVEVNQKDLVDKMLARYSSDFVVLRELLQNASDAQASEVGSNFKGLACTAALTLYCDASVMLSTKRRCLSQSHVCLKGCMTCVIVVLHSGMGNGQNDSSVSKWFLQVIMQCSSAALQWSVLALMSVTIVSLCCPILHIV